MATLLEQPHLSVITRHADAFLARVQDTVEHKVLVDGQADVDNMFARLLAEARETVTAPAHKTLDLIGHSTPGDSLLQLGGWVIDCRSATVMAWFRELAERAVLPRLGIQAVRLLGCSTAETEAGQQTIVALSDALGLEVYGTRGPFRAAHCNASGFDPGWRFLLVGSGELRDRDRHVSPSYSPKSYALSVSSLPVWSCHYESPTWPCRVATLDDARHILELVRCDEGAPMPGDSVVPSCELRVLRTPDVCHLEFVFEETFVRVYPDGRDRPGVVYPVSDPDRVRSILDTLPIDLDEFPPSHTSA